MKFVPLLTACVIALVNSLVFYFCSRGFELTGNTSLALMLFIVIYFIILRTWKED